MAPSPSPLWESRWDEQKTIPNREAEAVSVACLYLQVESNVVNGSPAAVLTEKPEFNSRIEPASNDRRDRG